jgi:DNA-binding Xre family transcriptional regulator
MEHSLYLSALKKALRARGLTYADLAAQLGMSESGVKKMFNAKDMSFRRVVQVCGALDITPGQLFTLSEETVIAEVTLSQRQEEALLEDALLLQVYWRLAVEKREPHEIASLHRLDGKQLKRLLDRLVRLELLSLRRGQYRPRHSGKFRWSDGSRLARFLNRSWSQLTLRRALASNGAALHRLVAMQIAPDAYAELVRGLSAALDQAVHSSARDEISRAREGLHGFSALVAVVPGSVCDPEGSEAKMLRHR